MAKAFFVSDVHINRVGDLRYRRFSAFLDYINKESAEHLFILGDLFEFLYGKGDYIAARYKELFDKLEKISRNGTKIYYLYGNHDFNFKLPFDFIESIESLGEVKINGLNCMVFHGDGLDPEDYKYRFLRSVVRSGFFKLCAKFIPNVLLYRMADFCSTLSRNTNGNKMVNNSRFLCYREDALNKLKATSLDVVVFAHTHVADLSRLHSDNGKFKYYLNSGFFGNDGTYGFISGDTVYIGVFNNKVLIS